MAVAVDRDAIGLAVPGADRRLQIADIVVHLDLRLDPIGHFGREALAADIAFEGRAHFDDVEVDRAGGDRLLQARVVVGLRQIDPVDLGAGIGFPRLQEAAEQKIVQVLVVEAHEGQLNALEFAFLDIRLGGSQGTFRRLSASRHPSANLCRRPEFAGSAPANCLGPCAVVVMVPSEPAMPAAETAAVPLSHVRRFITMRL